MGGKVQTQYPRKNWSSLMLMNCAELGAWTKEAVETQTGAWLHRFEAIPDEQIGDISEEWNVLDHMTGPTKLLHYTSGGPWLKGCEDADHADLWHDTARSTRPPTRRADAAMTRVRRALLAAVAALARRARARARAVAPARRSRGARWPRSATRSRSRFAPARRRPTPCARRRRGRRARSRRQQPPAAPPGAGAGAGGHQPRRRRAQGLRPAQPGRAGGRRGLGVRDDPHRDQRRLPRDARRHDAGRDVPQPVRRGAGHAQPVVFPLAGLRGEHPRPRAPARALRRRRDRPRGVGGGRPARHVRRVPREPAVRARRRRPAARGRARAHRRPQPPARRGLRASIRAASTTVARCSTGTTARSTSRRATTSTSTSPGEAGLAAHHLPARLPRRAAAPPPRRPAGHRRFRPPRAARKLKAKLKVYSATHPRQAPERPAGDHRPRHRNRQGLLPAGRRAPHVQDRPRRLDSAGSRR